MTPAVRERCGIVRAGPARTALKRPIAIVAMGQHRGRIRPSALPCSRSFCWHRCPGPRPARPRRPTASWCSRAPCSSATMQSPPPSPRCSAWPPPKACRPTPPRLTADFTPVRLARYRVVVFANTTGDVLDAAQQRALEGFIRAGGGFAGLHAAADTEYDWPWYGARVGAYFRAHPPGLQDTRVQPERDGRTRGTAWPIRGEIYTCRDNPRARARGRRGGRTSLRWRWMGDDHRSPGATPSMAATAGTPGWVMTRRCIAIQTSSRSCGRGCATRPAHRRAAEWHRAPSRAPSPRRSSRLRRPSHRPRSARRRAALPATPGSSPPRCSR